LLGPRQTGKSTLINARLPADSFSVNLLHRDRFLQLSKDPSLLRREVEAWLAQRPNTRQVLFIDEIQRLPVLLDEIHDLIERFKNLQVILTGSSARKLKRGGVNLGGGRLLENHLFPLTVDELGAAFHLESVLRFGTLPSLFVTEAEDGTLHVRRRNDAECRDILRAYVSLYLKEEVQEEALTRNIGDFSRFLDVAAAQNGEVLNVSNIARECAVDRKTVSAYFSIVEDTLLGFPLLPWRKSIRKRLSVHPKFYFFDLGVVNALTQSLTDTIHPQLRGRFFEHFLILETYRLSVYRKSEAGLFYWRTNTGAEVDLVIAKHGQPIAACEFKSGRSAVHGSFSGLASFAVDYPDVPRYVVAELERPQLVGQTLPVRIIPWREYCQMLHDLL
jgi:predicted AAA+ superfamily ATPase